jgi:hypothetical protein
MNIASMNDEPAPRREGKKVWKGGWKKRMFSVASTLLLLFHGKPTKDA